MRAAFDVCGPLPTGTTVLEASAGTGKTFTIAALAARYLAEGRAELSELMLVTFGREATNELRERVRERLVSAERGLADPAAARSGPDAVLALLAGADDAEVAARRARLVRALTQFDAATIATTHQFCQRMLAGLGVAGDADPDAVFVESVDDLLDRGGRRLLRAQVRRPRHRLARRSAGPTALTMARRAVSDGQARLEPVDAEPGSPADVRRRFAAAVRAEVDHGASRPAGSTPTTTCSPGSTPRWPTRRGARRSGCAPGTGWCWSTSSRTPTRCSGRSCGAPSTTGRSRWC